jgi:ketosteroid isomerase-like protein
MSEISFVGGSDADRQSVAAQHRAYLEVNAMFDWEGLQPIWSGAADATFFNMNGHTYDGRAHWTKLWQYYKQHMQTGEWVPYDMKGSISGDLAVVWCHRKTRLIWKDDESRPVGQHHVDKPQFTSRSTMVFRREDGAWRVVHVHFSEASTDPRPGGI